MKNRMHKLLELETFSASGERSNHSPIVHAWNKETVGLLERGSTNKNKGAKSLLRSDFTTGCLK